MNILVEGNDNLESPNVRESLRHLGFDLIGTEYVVGSGSECNQIGRKTLLIMLRVGIQFWEIDWVTDGLSSRRDMAELNLKGHFTSGKRD